MENESYPLCNWGLWCNPEKDIDMLPLGLIDFLRIAEAEGGEASSVRVLEFSPSQAVDRDSIEHSLKIFSVLDEGGTPDVTYHELRAAAEGWKGANWIDVILTYDGPARELIILADDSTAWAVGGDSILAETVARAAIQAANGKLCLWKRVTSPEGQRKWQSAE